VKDIDLSLLGEDVKPGMCFRFVLYCHRDFPWPNGAREERTNTGVLLRKSKLLGASGHLRMRTSRRIPGFGVFWAFDDTKIAGGPSGESHAASG